MARLKDLENRLFRFSRTDGSVVAEKVRLLPGGKIEGHRHPNEHSWAIDGGNLVFQNESGVTTTIFNTSKGGRNRLVLSGPFVSRGFEPWHVLTRLSE